MRADRMVAIVLLLQARGQMTAPEMAEELEVSERTIRRDLDALLMAGVPLYSQRGRGGGWALLDGHRLDLSGFTAAEAQALFLVAGPQALSGLGVEAGVRSALRKLLSALPEAVREEVARATSAVHVDPERWSEGPPAAPAEALGTLREAVMSGRQVDLTYTKPAASPTTRRVHPYGLVSKAGVWYLVAGTSAGLRTFRLSRVDQVEVRDEPVEKPEGFDLAKAWGEVRARMSARTSQLPVDFEVERGSERQVAVGLGAWVPLRAVPEHPGRFAAVFPNEWVAAAELARFGRRVRVVGPDTVRHRLIQLGEELLAAHGGDRP